jgi:hypothetical protein
MMMMGEEEEVEEEKTEMGMIDRKVEVQIDSEVEMMMLFRHPSIAVQMGNENDSLTIFLLPLDVFAVLLPFLTILTIAMGFLLLSSWTSRTSPTLPHCEHEL